MLSPCVISRQNAGLAYSSGWINPAFLVFFFLIDQGDEGCHQGCYRAGPAYDRFLAVNEHFVTCFGVRIRGHIGDFAACKTNFNFHIAARHGGKLNRSCRAIHPGLIESILKSRRLRRSRAMPDAPLKEMTQEARGIYPELKSFVSADVAIVVGFCCSFRVLPLIFGGIVLIA